MSNPLPLVTKGTIRVARVGASIGIKLNPSDLVNPVSLISAVLGIRVFDRNDPALAGGVLWSPATGAVQADGTYLVSYLTIAGDVPASPTRLYLWPEFSVAGFTDPKRSRQAFVLDVLANEEP